CLIVVGLSFALSGGQRRLVKPAVVFEPGVTYDLLKVADPVLEFHSGKEADLSIVNGELRMITDGFGLARLGETNSGDFSFRTKLRQHTVQGRAGLFFGLRKSAGPNVKYVFETLEI